MSIIVRPSTSEPLLTRRDVLKAGSLALGGLSLAELLRLRARGGSSTPNTSVILVWLGGGPSHLETYDLKPDAPTEIRGPFGPIQTVIPGMDICEHLPLHAKIADKFTIIRSIRHKYTNHAGATGRFLGGRKPADPLKEEAEFPCIGPIVAKMPQRHHPDMPTYVSTAKRLYGGGSAYLGEPFHPFVVDGDPNGEDFKVKDLALSPEITVRLDDRVRLLQSVNELRRDLDAVASLQTNQHFAGKHLTC